MALAKLAGLTDKYKYIVKENLYEYAETLIEQAGLDEIEDEELIYAIYEELNEGLQVIDALTEEDSIDAKASEIKQALAQLISNRNV